MLVTPDPLRCHTLPSMFYVDDMVMFAWRDLDPNYLTTGQSDITNPWINQTGDSVCVFLPSAYRLIPN